MKLFFLIIFCFIILIHVLKEKLSWWPVSELLFECWFFACIGAGNEEVLEIKLLRLFDKLILFKAVCQFYGIIFLDVSFESMRLFSLSEFVFHLFVEILFIYESVIHNLLFFLIFCVSKNYGNLIIPLRYFCIHLLVIEAAQNAFSIVGYFWQLLYPYILDLYDQKVIKDDSDLEAPMEK